VAAAVLDVDRCNRFHSFPLVVWRWRSLYTLKTLQYDFKKSRCGN
jgi:hypothetical protein